MVANEQLSKLIDAISCPICKCCIVDPYVLPCNHYYCRLVYIAIISIHLYCFQKSKTRMSCLQTMYGGLLLVVSKNMSFVWSQLSESRYEKG
jgi:hypothetical protein